MKVPVLKVFWLAAALAVMSGCVTEQPYEEPAEEEVLPPEEPEPAALIQIKNFESPELGNKRTVRILLPESYAASGESYPVVYFHDGKNVFSPGGQFGAWAVEKAYARLRAEGKIREAVLVGIDNTSRRMGEYTPTPDPKHKGGEGDKYLDFIQKTLMPLVNSQYRTLQGPENTALIGSSLGGLISFYGGWTRPQVFGMVGCLSSSFWWDGGRLVGEVRKTALEAGTPGGTSEGRRVKIYLDAGNLEGGDPDGNGAADMVEDSLDMALALRKLGWQSGRDLLVDIDPQGQHNERFWRERVGNVLQFFLGNPGESLAALDPAAARKALGGEGQRTMAFVGAYWNNGLKGDLLPGDYQVTLPRDRTWKVTERGELLLEKSSPGSGGTSRFLFEAGRSQGSLEITVMD